MTPHKLLLADDSATIRKVVELTFADEGVVVSAVADGDAAMQKFVEIQPDIVLVDVNMPGPNGYHICEMIKQDEATKHIPVILLVGSFEPFDQTEAERVGADGFLTKPFHSIHELVEKVTELLISDDKPDREVAETADIDDLYKSSFGETVKIPPAATTDTFLGDAGMDDEMIEASFPAEPRDEPVASGFVPSSDQDESMAKLDWSAEPVDPAAVTAELVNGRFEPRSVFEESELLEVSAKEEAVFDEPDADEGVTRAGNSPMLPEPSPEFIATVARMVVEKLSDKVIREIAQEAVPRIAENLIREALEDDKKN